jgi:hypothetical protein
MYFSQATKKKINLGQLPGVFMAGETRLPGDEYTGSPSQLLGGEYIEESPVVNTTGSQLRKFITPRKFGEIQNLFCACLLGLGEVI